MMRLGTQGTGEVMVGRAIKLKKGNRAKRYEALWHSRLKELKVFKAKYGHCDVPKKYFDNRSLGGWAINQRLLYRKNHLSAERVALLESIGFRWEVIVSWHQNLEALRVFKSTQGHCNVPVRYTENPALGHWVRTQRHNYKNKTLRADRACVLDAMGFQWRQYALNWHGLFNRLKKFKDEHGHCNVPYIYPDNRSLGRWVNTQRYFYKKNRLSAERIALLESMGFLWDIIDKLNWAKKFEELRVFKSTHGHCNVSNTYFDTRSLGNWVRAQRHKYKNKTLSLKRISILNAMGFTWSVYSPNWHSRLEELKVFKAQYGHCSVPKEYMDNLPLANWVKTQRACYKNKKLSLKRISILKAMGFTWSVYRPNWHSRLEELKVFKAQHGHCAVPIKYIDNIPLGNWVGTQRGCYKNKTLSKKKYNALNAMGFQWTPLEVHWNKMFEVLKTFKKKIGYCDVSARYMDNSLLAGWAVEQRQSYTKNSLSLKRIVELEVIGFMLVASQSNWRKMFGTLEQFKKKYGHCHVVTGYIHAPLVHWVMVQRQNHKNGKLSAEQAHRLESLGFSFSMKPYLLSHLESRDTDKHHGLVTLLKGIKDDTNLATINSMALRKKIRGKHLVVNFHLKNITYGNMKISQGFSDLYKKYRSCKTEILNISCDSLAVQVNIKRRHKLPFEFISDFNGSICKEFEVIRQIGKAYTSLEEECTTFLFNRQGYLVNEWRNVKNRGHAHAVLAMVRKLIN